MITSHTRIVNRALTRLKLKQLQLLVAVGRHRSILHAARELGLSQPAATKMIQELEIDFEVRLFDRSNRGVVPTVYGEALIRHGKLMFAQVSNAAQEIVDLNEGNSGRVVVGTLLAASSHLLPMAITMMLRTRPNIAIEVVEGTNEDLMPMLRSGELDMLVGRLPVHRLRSELHQVRLYEEEVALVVGSQHPLAGREELNFDDLKEFGWILPPSHITLRRYVDQYFVKNDQTFSPTPQIESLCYLTNVALLRSTDLIAVMSEQIALEGFAHGTLSRLSIRLPFGSGPVGATFRTEESLSPTAAAFLKSLNDVARTMPGG
ncbi:LysR family transcriptional regulator [Pararhizobium sp. O133]|uniref:LysR family transcriptional regulator n=1 Tax=Pararhizobium sp. O133 TaxID=3449278 RepID=UPI003F68673A